MINLDDKNILKIHRKIIREKTFLKNIYHDFYNQFRNIKFPKGKIVELGSGAGFIKEVLPKVITSDVIKGKDIDRVFLAERMPFKTSELGGILMINVLHHIKDSQKALREMERCLKENGKIVMIEPYNSIWGRFIYQNLHHENFDASAGWKIKGKGRLSDANIALPWIIFTRDREKYKKMFTTLKIVRITPHTPFRYLISGGLSKPQLLPNSFYKFIKSLEEILSFMNPFIGMFVTIELQKTSGNRK